VAEVDQIDFESDQPSQLDAPRNEIGYLVRHFDLLKERLAQSRRQLRAAQHQVYQAEKLASVGRLASGVAHEVNNPLNGIRFCVHGIQSDPGNAEQAARYLGLIDEGIQQIESVVQKLLGFARSQPATFERISVNEQLHVVLDLLEFQFRQKDVAVQVVLPPDRRQVRADATLMKEVFMNLLMNSIDAVELGGSIRVQSGLADDDRLFVSITDNGSGIRAEHITQIFEPFFTTKETGRGTGLGLSVTLGIVELHGGTIRVHSEPRLQTTFTVVLPREVAA
jgi:signal transduction histidine kinase